MSRPAACALLLLAVPAVGACGNELTRPPDVATPDPPVGRKVVRLKEAGVRFAAPVNWSELPVQGSRAGGIQSKRATIAVWRYPRSEPLPTTSEQLREAGRRLVTRVRRRDRSFRLDTTALRERGGAPAIELRGEQTIAGLRFGVRSTHMFFSGAEIVVDAFAPPEHFERVDRTVVRPLLRSLRLTEPA